LGLNGSPSASSFRRGGRSMGIELNGHSMGASADDSNWRSRGSEVGSIPGSVPKSAGVRGPGPERTVGGFEKREVRSVAGSVGAASALSVSKDKGDKGECFARWHTSVHAHADGAIGLQLRFVSATNHTHNRTASLTFPNSFGTQPRSMPFLQGWRLHCRLELPLLPRRLVPYNCQTHRRSSSVVGEELLCPSDQRSNGTGASPPPKSRYASNILIT
jgi:hypothetical protein